MRTHPITTTSPKKKVAHDDQRAVDAVVIRALLADQVDDASGDGRSNQPLVAHHQQVLLLHTILPLSTLTNPIHFALAYPSPHPPSSFMGERTENTIIVSSMISKYPGKTLGQTFNTYNSNKNPSIYT